MTSAQRRRRMLMKQIRFAVIVILLIAAIITVALIVRNKSKSNNDPIIKPETTISAAVSSSPIVTIAPLTTSEPVSEATPDTALPTEEATNQPQSDTTKSGGLRSAHIRVIGDVMFHAEQLKIAEQSDGSYDFTSQFKYIKDSLANADYTIANLETTVGKYNNMSYSGYPQFNTPESVLVTLKDCGIDFFTMANNHMLDRWCNGLIHDVDLMEQYGFDHVGAYRTQAERDKPVIYEVEGIKIGFVAYTHSTNTLELTSDKEVIKYAVPYIQDANFKTDIQKLREAGAEVVIALPHWGTENVNQQDETQENYAKKLAKAGADIILGSHSHMVQKMNKVTGTDANGNAKDVFLIYSMGNFISTMTMQYTDNGLILDFTLNENSDGTFSVDDIGYVPIYVWKQNKQLYVISSAKYLNNRPEGMNDEQYNRMKESYNEIVNQLGTKDFKVLTE